MDEFTATLDKWEQEIINNVETLISLNKLMAFMQKGQCLIATDGSASDDMMLFAWKVVDVTDPDWDIIAQICNILELMNIKAEFQHMKGHQDDAKHYEELDLPAQLNINVNFLAVNY
eukprot:9713481-Ditylum_brightwellii.AAC.1